MLGYVVVGLVGLGSLTVLWLLAAMKTLEHIQAKESVDAAFPAPPMPSIEDEEASTAWFKSRNRLNLVWSLFWPGYWLYVWPKAKKIAAALATVPDDGCNVIAGVPRHPSAEKPPVGPWRRSDTRYRMQTSADVLARLRDPWTGIPHYKK